MSLPSIAEESEPLIAIRRFSMSSSEVLLGLIFLKEKLELFHIVGALLIFTGIYLVIRKRDKNE